MLDLSGKTCPAHAPSRGALWKIHLAFSGLVMTSSQAQIISKKTRRSANAVVTVTFVLTWAETYQKETRGEKTLIADVKSSTGKSL